MNTKKLTRRELLLTNIGIVVGSGVVTTTGLAIAVTGRSVHVAYFLAIILGLLQAIPTAINCSIMRIEGGNYALARVYAGPLVAGATSLTNVLNFFGNGMMSIALAAYITSLVPSLDSRIVGAVLFTLFFLVNLRSTKLMSKVSSVITVAMFGGLGLFVVFGLFHLNSNPFEFTAPDFFMGGSQGVFSAAVMLVFSTQSIVMASYYSSLSARPKKDVPWVILVTCGVITVIYCSVSMVAGNILPVSEVAGLPLTKVAMTVMPRALAVIFILLGPCMCLSSTINGGFVTFYSPLTACAKEGFLPAAVAKTNKNNIPYRIVIAQWIAGLIPILTKVPLSTLVNSLMLTLSLSGIFVRVALFRMPTMFPEQWKKSHLHMPNWLYYIFTTLAILVNLFLIYNSSKRLSPVWLILNFGVLALSFVFCYIRIKMGKVSPRAITYSLDDEEEEG